MEAGDRAAAGALATAIVPDVVGIVFGSMSFISVDCVVPFENTVVLKSFTIASLPMPFSVVMAAEILVRRDDGGVYIIGNNYRAYAADQSLYTKAQADVYAAFDAWLIENGAVDGESILLV